MVCWIHKCGICGYEELSIFSWTLWCLRSCLPTWYESRFSVWQSFKSWMGLTFLLREMDQDLRPGSVMSTQIDVINLHNILNAPCSVIESPAKDCKVGNSVIATCLTEVRPQNTLSHVQFSSVTQSCLTLCDPRNHSMPGLPVHHHLPELTQTYVHQVSDAIQPSHPLSSPSPPAPNSSQHQGLFQWVNSSHEVAKVLEFQL